jgi:hypothetical protein
MGLAGGVMVAQRRPSMLGDHPRDAQVQMVMTVLLHFSGPEEPSPATSLPF